MICYFQRGEKVTDPAKMTIDNVRRESVTNALNDIKVYRYMYVGKEAVRIFRLYK